LINQKIDTLRKALRDKRRQDVKQLARAVDAKVMQPVRKLIGETKWLLISPDGALNLVPFGALVDQKGHYLIQNYQFTYLTSGRDLLRLQVPIAARQGALVMANPDFGGNPRTEEERKLKLTQVKQAPSEETQTHLLRQFYFPPLPGTADEGEALRRILPNVTLLTQQKATKAALKQVDGPLILHIATHGFFLENLETGPLDVRALQPASKDPARLLLQQGAAGTAGWNVENPLLRSGLALAGANEHKSDDDGIMTALEVSGLSLWGTKLLCSQPVTLA
jgi:CHAT domain-containing protein